MIKSRDHVMYDSADFSDNVVELDRRVVVDDTTPVKIGRKRMPLTHFFPPFQHVLSERLRLSA